MSARVFAPLFLLLSGLVSSATAQTATSSGDGPSSSNPGLLEILRITDSPTLPVLADELVNSLGRSWNEIRGSLPEPDSSAIAAGLGDVWWSVSDVQVDGFRAFIQQGQVESVTLDFSPEGPDFMIFARRLYDHLGSPRADGFYATDQTGYPFSLAIDVQANRLTARVVPGQLVTE